MENKREQDIQTLCKAVLESGIQHEYNKNSVDRYRCIFCYMSVPDWNTESDIKHSLNCPYLIAKDLVVGYED